MAECERDHGRVRIEQRFNDLNRQIGELTTLVLTLTETLYSGNREGNGSDVQRSETAGHSDNTIEKTQRRLNKLKGFFSFIRTRNNRKPTLFCFFSHLKHQKKNKTRTFWAQKRFWNNRKFS